MTAVRGWCPDAWRPMAAGDGLLVRVRPRFGRVAREAFLRLCAAAEVHGSGQIDVTNRANLQVRGVSENAWRPLVATLVEAGLVDPDPTRERRGAILVAPAWNKGDDTHRIAAALYERLDELPDLPAKFGFAIDAGATPVLRNEAGDLRIERGSGGNLILRADGRAMGVALEPGCEADALIGLARWFVESGGGAAGRMRAHAAALPAWARGRQCPSPAARPQTAGLHPLGAAEALAFGRIEAAQWRAAVQASHSPAIRTTPWRILIVEDGMPSGVVDPLGTVDACVGAPACPQATVETRALARRLAPYVAGHLHVSGCSKGCARRRPAAVVLTGRGGHYDLALDAVAGASPAVSGLDADQILAHFGAN